MIRSLRDEALLILEGRGAILDVAREVSRVLGRAGVEAVVIGGVAVVLHGYARTTDDVDVLVADSLDDAGAALRSAGYKFDAAQREFRKGRVPVHFVTMQQVQTAPSGTEEVEGIRVVPLHDLINMKLSLGLRDPLRAQDLADVIGLIRHHRLTGEYAARLSRGVRVEFRKLARAIAKDSSRRDR